MADKAAWGSVRKWPSGRYEALYRVNGEMAAAPPTFRIRRDAEAYPVEAALRVIEQLLGVSNDVAWRLTESVRQALPEIQRNVKTTPKKTTAKKRGGPPPRRPPPRRHRPSGHGGGGFFFFFFFGGGGGGGGRREGHRERS